MKLKKRDVCIGLEVTLTKMRTSRHDYHSPSVIEAIDGDTVLVRQNGYTSWYYYHECKKMCVGVIW